MSTPSSTTSPASPGWGVPSTWFMAGGGLLEGTAVGTFLAAVGEMKAQVAVAAFGGLLLAIGSVLAQHGH